MRFCRPSFDAVKALLESADLPSADLPEDLEHFVGCGNPASPDGVVGLEIFGDLALLRSLVVSTSNRGAGLGKRLVTIAEEYAREKEVKTIYLLTETAERFFESLGYRSADRESAPASIRSTQEFSALCPDSAAFMVKELV